MNQTYTSFGLGDLDVNLAGREPIGQHSARLYNQQFPGGSVSSLSSAIDFGKAVRLPVNGQSNLAVEDENVSLFLNWLLTRLRTTFINRHENFHWICLTGLEKPRLQAGLVQQAEALIRSGKTNGAIDLIYDAVDNMMRENRLEELNDLLSNVPIETTSLDILISLLTTTLPVRSKLPSRSDFYQSVERVARKDAEWDEDLLSGLKS